MNLALDVSTSITGWCLTDDNDPATLLYGAWYMKNKNKFEDLFDKAKYIESELQEIQKKYNITKIIVEAPFIAFGGGASSAQTVATLQRFNGIVSYIVFKVFGIKPDYIRVQEARKLVGIKNAKGANAKKTVTNFLLDTDPRFVVEYTKQGNVSPRYIDMADAIVLAKSLDKK